MRRSRVEGKGWIARAVAAAQTVPGLALASLFVGLSGAISVTFGYSYGGLFFGAAALAFEGFADLAVPLFWHRLRIPGRAALLAFFVICFAYKLEAANQFALQILGQASAATATTTETFNAAKAKVEALRKTIDDNAGARAPAVIDAEIVEHLRDKRAEGCPAGGTWNGPITVKVCPVVDKLRRERAGATTRDEAQAKLPDALEAMGAATAAGGSVKQGAGPVVGFLALLGLHAGSAEVWAKLFMLGIEGGAILVPMLAGMHGRRPEDSEVAEPRREVAVVPAGRVVAQDAVVPAAVAALPAPSRGRNAREEREISELRHFLAVATEPVDGKNIQASVFHAAYLQWRQASGLNGDPINLFTFGKLLSKPIGLQKDKLDGGKTFYLNVVVRHQAGDQAKVAA